AADGPRRRGARREPRLERHCQARPPRRGHPDPAAPRRSRRRRPRQHPPRPRHLPGQRLRRASRPARRRRRPERGGGGGDHARRIGRRARRRGAATGAHQPRVRAAPPSGDRPGAGRRGARRRRGRPARDRRPAGADVDRLTQAYARAAGDPFDDARLSAVSALGAIAQASADGRLAVATRFVARVPRADDYLVRRLAAERLPDAADGWGPAAPIATGRSVEDYRDVARRYLVPALRGRPAPQVTIESDRGNVVVELLPLEAPLTVAAFL